MRKIIGTLVIFLTSLPVAAEHKIDYRISPLGNLVYQLDCLAQVSRFSCSRTDYQTLWQSEIEPHELDAEFINHWYKLRSPLDEKVSFTEVPNQQMATSPNFPVNANNSLNVLEQVRIMAFASGTKDAYHNTVGLLLSPNHVDQELRVLNHFWNRFEPWFTQKKPELKGFVDEAEILSKQVNLNDLLGSMRTFYHAELPKDLTLPVYLVAHPKAQANTSGLAFKQNSIIEVLQGEKAVDRLAVVVHEIAHFYHEQAPFEHHLEVMKFFTESDSKTGKVGYYLFNEGLASAIGNGILEKRLRKADSWERYWNYPMSFYADQGIDMAGKAALQLTTEQIAANKPIDQTYLSALDKQWTNSLATIKDNPQQRFRHVGMVNLTSGDGMGDELVNELFGLLRPSSAHVSDHAEIESERFILNRHPALDVLILANTWEQLMPLNLTGLNKPHEVDQWMQILTTETGAKQVIVVSPSAAFFIDQVEQLLGQATFPVDD